MSGPDSQFLGNLYSSWLSRLGSEPAMGLEAMREMFETWHSATLEPTAVTYRDVDADGVDAMWAIPDGAADSVLLHLHGGGFSGGSKHSHRKLAAHLAKACGARALVLNYRLAPEHTFPAQLDDAETAFDWLVAQGIPADQIVVVGDSAGGGLAFLLIDRLRQAGKALPGGLVALSPWTDLNCTGASLDDNSDVLISRPLLQQMAAIYLGANADQAGAASPLSLSVDGFPPVLVLVGQSEALLNDSTRMVDKLVQAGVDAEIDVTPDMQHVFPFMAGRSPEADRAVHRVGAWVRAHNQQTASVLPN